MTDVLYIVRNVRMPLSLDTEIRHIAECEDRTISKTIQRLLQRAVKDYFADKGQSILEHEGTMRLFEEKTIKENK